MAKRGRGCKCLTPQDIIDIHALADKGYQQRTIAALFGVCRATVHRTLHHYRPVLTLPLMPKGRPWERNWIQRVIWAAK